jgi:twitching motility protein PilT
MERLLDTVLQLKASDLHIAVGQPPVIRHNGRMRKLDTKVLDPDDTTALMKAITPDRCQQELQEVGGADFAIEYREGTRFRCAIFKQRGNIGLVMRRIPSQFLSFEQIGMPEAIKRLITKPRGLLLVTGPTGSGKTTSLASMINFLNANYDKHIITLEDPIEYYHKHNKCTVNQREIGVDCPSFKEGIRRALRMDPDIILVGEMRDLDTIHAAIKLWREQIVEKEEALMRSGKPAELAARMAQYEKGIVDEEDEEYDEDYEGDDDYDDDDDDDDRGKRRSTGYRRG